MLEGMQEAYRKGSSESILASSLAGDIARCRLKRRQRYWWAGLLSFEKPMVQDADSVPSGGRQHGSHVIREWWSGPAQSKNPRTLRNNMHENREISSTPWSDDQGRAAKSMNRTERPNPPAEAEPRR